jgi:hypothetical protein
VPHAQRAKVIDSKEFERVNGLSKARIFPEELAARAGKLVLTFRASMRAEIEKATFASHRFAEFLENVEVHRDREWWRV